eukprot:CAMPEP_0115031910 /NCGR_PEP_ID=MMETSP0216-20121206/38842_1 /TAXON_ID=223996 /ORGANISM="Protocruzia adherens, Strain Boccale" /LENGTH=185 /DNA_ID=CAMNT_0002409705 /DNA_START=294 /DNA_END=851 /DNA_ORIENTATION=+
MEEVTDVWEGDLLPRFESEAENQENLLKLKHANEIQEFKRSQLEDKTLKVHFSPALLNIRKKEQNLAQMGKYTEANALKQKGDLLEKSEEEKHVQIRKEKILHRTQMLVKKHQKEMKVLKERNKKQREGLHIKYENEIKLLRKRYNNVRRDIEQRQRLERMNLLKNSPFKKMERKEAIHKIKVDV